MFRNIFIEKMEDNFTDLIESVLFTVAKVKEGCKKEIDIIRKFVEQHDEMTIGEQAYKFVYDYDGFKDGVSGNHKERWRVAFKRIERIDMGKRDDEKYKTKSNNMTVSLIECHDEANLRNREIMLISGLAKLYSNPFMKSYMFYDSAGFLYLVQKRNIQLNITTEPEFLISQIEPELRRLFRLTEEERPTESIDDIISSFFLCLRNMHEFNCDYYTHYPQNI